MNGKTPRQSNIELLRIFAAMGVIFVHLNNRNLGGIAAKADRFGLCQFVLVLLGVFAITAVNVFALITGYFQANKKSADVFRPIRLIIDVIIISAIFFTAYLITSGGNYEFGRFIGEFVPTNWFIPVYGGLYILSPFINKLWDSLKNKDKAVLVAATFLLYSVYPVIIDLLKLEGLTTYGLDGDQRGYNIVNLVLMYLIGCALRSIDENKDAAKKTAAGILHVPETSIRNSILPVLLLIDVIVMLAIIYLSAYFGDKHPYSSSVFHYNNPLLIILTVLLFLTFKGLKMRENKVINFVAPSAFYVYIIHLHFIRLFKVGSVEIDDALSMLCFMISIIILIYIACFACYIVYRFTFGKLLDLISIKWQKGRYIKVD